MKRLGFTLLEMVIAIAIALLVGATILPLLTASTRRGLHAKRALAAERDRLALSALFNWAIPRNAASDISAGVSQQLDFDRPVGQAIPCFAGINSITIPQQGWQGARPPQPSRDDLLLLTDSASIWTRQPVVMVSTGSCTGAVAAWEIHTGMPIPTTYMVRVVEPLRLRAYSSGRSQWLGLEGRQGAGTIQPIAGPMGPAPLIESIQPRTLNVKLTWLYGLPGMEYSSTLEVAP